jgi:hypothetical protein
MICVIHLVLTVIYTKVNWKELLKARNDSNWLAESCNVSYVPLVDSYV